MNNIKSYDEYVNEGFYDWMNKPINADTDITTIVAILSVVVTIVGGIWSAIAENWRDADAYTKVVVYRERKEDVIKIIDFAEWADELGGHGLEEKMWEIAEKVGVYDIIEGDATNDGQTPASPSVEKVTYFDESGIEHSVKIKQKKIRADYKREWRYGGWHR